MNANDFFNSKKQEIYELAEKYLLNVQTIEHQKLLKLMNHQISLNSMILFIGESLNIKLIISNQQKKYIDPLYKLILSKTDMNFNYEVGKLIKNKIIQYINSKNYVKLQRNGILDYSIHFNNQK